MLTSERLPAAVLICHQSDRLDSVGLASWLAATMRLAGVVEIQGDRRRLLRAIRREYSRSGLIGLLDVLAFRAFARLRHRAADARWINFEVRRLQRRYPARLDTVPRLTVSDPNCEAARAFIKALTPDLIIARCKFILKPAIYTLATHGSFALHPGICPEYRNSHGCFWALANRDLDRVGMTLLKIDSGVDTGPVLLQAGCAFDETRESHTTIQHRVVTENLDRIGAALFDVVNGTATAIDTSTRRSAAWGQPRLSTYLRWQRDALRARPGVDRVSVVP
jgi:folate-dependent phosphoribosylglycinamide formyltransferase PurN